MDDQDEHGSRSAPLGARVRSALGEVRRQGVVSLRDVRRSVTEAKDRLKSTEAAEKLGAAFETRYLIKRAADAQRRGNHAMAYRLLEPEVRARPEDAKLVIAFWNAALACERAQDAVPAMLLIIRRLASTGEPGRAAQLWMELRRATPSARVDPSSLVRMVPALQADGRPDRVVEALREAVDPRNSGLSPGLAVRVAEIAGEIDPPTALRAARRALASPDIHEAKRARLEGLVAEFEKAKAAAAPDTPTQARVPAAVGRIAPAPSAAPAPAPEPGSQRVAAVDPHAAAGLTERAVDEALEPRARFSDIKVTEGMPTGLLEDAVALQLPAGRKARVEYAKIEALAVVEVRDLTVHPVLVIDLVLNWSERGDSALRIVRFRSDGFDPRMVIATPMDAVEAFRGFLSELFERSNAVPLPDLDSALGVKVRAFDSVEAYQREVLQVAS